MTVTWHGVIPALMTEMKQDGALDLPATARHLESSLNAGCEGFVMLGTLGENSSLSPDEKETVVRAAVEAAAGRVPVFAGIAEYTTDLAIESARRAKRAGAAGLMALPTMVYQTDAREAVHHFRTLARAVDLPIMIYNNHVAYKVDLKPEDFVELQSEANIVAVKESSHDSRRKDEALAIYRWFMPLLHLDVAVKLVQYIKLVNQMTGEGSEWVRAPRLTLVGEERKRVESLVEKALATRPKLA